MWRVKEWEEAGGHEVKGKGRAGGRGSNRGSVLEQ